MRARMTLDPRTRAAIYEGVVAAAGWGALVWLTLSAGQALPIGGGLLFLAWAVALKREGFRVAPLVTHSLAGVAQLGAVVALGALPGGWVAALAALLFLATRRDGGARLRLAAFAGGVGALLALGAGALYRALGGAVAPATLGWGDLGPLVAASVAWFLGDHLAWSVRIGLEEGWAGVGRFLRAIGLYSLAVELSPLPLAGVVAVSYRALGLPSFILFALFLLAVGEVLRHLNLTLNRARERVADLSTLSALSRALLASPLEVRELSRQLLAHTQAVLSGGSLWLGLYDERRQRLQAVPEGAGVPPPPQALEWAQKHRSPLRIRDAQREVLPFSAAQVPFRSALLVPLVASGGLIGLFAAQSERADAFSDDDLRTVVTFANQTAMAIQNARAYEAEERRSRQVATVGQVSRRVAAILGIEQLFAEVVGLVRDAFGYFRVQLFTVDPATGEVQFQASTSPVIQEQGLSVRRGEGLIGWVAETGEQLVVNDVAAEPRYRRVEGLPEARSEAVVPLKVEERLVGILDVQSDRRDAFGEDDLVVLRTLADQLAIAIEDSRLYRAEKARRQLADTLREMAAALNSTLELRAVLDLVLTQLRRVIRYDAAAILEWRAGSYCIVAGRGPKYGSPDYCLAAAEDAQLRRLVAEREPIVYAGPEAEGAPPVLAAPLVVRGHLIGALVLERQGAAAYGAEETQVAAAFANQAAVAIENAHLYEAQERRARQLGMIAEVGRRVASILDLDELFVQVVHLVREAFGYYHVSLFTLDEESGAVEFRAATDPVIQERGISVRPGQGIIGWVAGHGESLLANDVSREPRYQAEEALPRAQSELAVPLRVEDRTVGVLDIQGDRPDAFSPEDLFIAQTLADQVAVAIENARLYAGQQEEAWVSTALLQVAETLANLTGIEEVLDAVVHLVALLVGVDRCAVFLRDEDTGEFRARRAHGLGAGEREGLLGRTLEGLAPGVWGDLQESTVAIPLGPGQAEAALGIATGLALPLRAGGEMIGALVAGYVSSTVQPNRNRRAILTGIANQAAMAVRNAHLYIAQREEAWVSGALLQVSELAGRTKELDEILAELVRLTPMLVGVDRCLVFLWDRERRTYRPAQAYGFADALRERLRALAFAAGDFPLLDRVRETGLALAVEQVAGSELVPGALAEAAGMVSVLALPLRSQAEVQGIMLVDYAGRAHRFSPRRTALLAGIANQAGIAIENVALYRESLERERIAQELQVARQIQATFLPESCPELEGWSVAVSSRPAREVGGDFYDFIPLGRGRWGLVIADVSDKGVPAALFMALSRNVMRAVAAEGRSPVATLERVNRLLLADSRSGMFVTLFYGILDTRAGELVYASGGQNPPYWQRRASGELERLVARGIALGVIERPHFEERRLVLEPGDALVLYTDGVTESFDALDREFGEAGLQAAVRGAGAAAAGQVVEAINRAVADFVRGAPQHDDYTLLVVTRDGQATGNRAHPKAVGRGR